MALTWENREGDRLTSHGYGQAGGVSHAVQTGADKVYDALPAGQQALARDVLRSMTVAGRDGRLTRRPVTRADLYAGLPTAARSEVDAVLEAFAAERLVVLDGDRAQISHDVLLRAWPRLRGWLEEDQASWILHGQLADDAAAWHDNRDDPSFLYRGTQLAALQQAATRWSANPARYPALTGTQRDFLHASERAATRSSRQRRSAVAVLALFADSGLTRIARHRASRLQQPATPRSSSVTRPSTTRSSPKPSSSAASDAPLAAQLNLAAYRMQPTQDLASRLLSTENTPLSPPWPQAAATPLTRWRSAPTGARWPAAITTARSGCGMSPTRRIPGRSASPEHRQRTPSTRWRSAPMGARWPAASADGTIWLWNVADPAHPQPLGQPLTAGSSSAVYSVAFSPDGRTLASGTSTARSGCGTSPTRRTPARSASPEHRQRQRRRLGGVQPRRAHAGQRQPRRHDPAVELSPTQSTPARLASH